MNELKENPHKRRKTTEGDTEFKSQFYVSSGKDERADTESLWLNSEKFNVDDLNLNLLPDDEKSLLKHTQQMKWDDKKKRYVQVNVNKDGSRVSSIPF